MKQIKNSLKDQSGQMAILVMLVLVVALTIGLAIIARTTTDIRLSTNTNQSNQAYAAAEAGIEAALGNNISAATYGTSVPIGNATFNVSIPAAQGGTTTPFAFPNELKKDEAGQIWLFDYSFFKNPANSIPPAQPYSGFYNRCFPTSNCNQIAIYWGTKAASTPSKTAALEASFIYKDSSGFGVEKYAYDNQSATRANGFDTVAFAPTTITTNQGSKTYNFSKTITLQPGDTGSGTCTAGAARCYLLLRIKLLYNEGEDQGVAVAPQAALVSGNTTPLPAQGTQIDSEGKAGDTVRKVRVYQSYPTLPGIFDFVVFNGSTNPLQKN
ncbi:MAG: hypothetical protein M3Q44_01695 [bacterium]|nr:hypothetical protein [bacterium]